MLPFLLSCPFVYPPFCPFSLYLSFLSFLLSLLLLSSTSSSPPPPPLLLPLLSSATVLMQNVTLMAEKGFVSLPMAQILGSIAHEQTIAGQSSATVYVMWSAIYQSVSTMLMSVSQRTAALQSKCVSICLSVYLSVCLSVCLSVLWLNGEGRLRYICCTVWLLPPKPSAVNSFTPTPHCVLSEGCVRIALTVPGHVG